MKHLVVATVGLALCVVAAHLASAQDKPAPPPLATITLTDVVTGMERIEEKKIELRLSAAGGKNDPLTAPRVLVDETKVKVNPFGKTPVAFQGRLSTKEVVVGMTNSIPPGKITATTLLLTADKATEITADNKAQFPAVGSVRVEGKLLTTTEGTDTTSSIANGDRPILLLGKDGKPLRELKGSGMVTATGRLRGGEKGSLSLETEAVEESKLDK